MVSTGKHAVGTADGLGAALPSRRTGRARRPGRAWVLFLAVLLGGYLALAGVDLFKVPISAPAPSSAPRAHPTVAAAPTLAAPATSSAPVSATRSTTPPQPLTAASLAAFGPDGTADGDNQGSVTRIGTASASAVAAADLGDTSQAWHSSWYATSAFGNLKAGTGLLLDMGHPVSVSSVHLVLGLARGADVRVLVGDSPSLAALRQAATANGAGGTLRLTAPHPVSGRYVVVWFTRLPPDGVGHFQADVYGVTVEGTAASS